MNAMETPMNKSMQINTEYGNVVISVNDHPYRVFLLSYPVITTDINPNWQQNAMIIVITDDLKSNDCVESSN